MNLSATLPGYARGTTRCGTEAAAACTRKELQVLVGAETSTETRVQSLQVLLLYSYARTPHSIGLHRRHSTVPELA